MFELLFSRPSAITRHRSAPLLNERLLYLAHCEQVGIKPATLRKIAAHQLNLVRVLDLRDDDSLNRCRLEAGVRQWSSPEERQSQPLARRRFFSHAERWLRFLGWLEEPAAACHTHTREVMAFAARMSGERGWSDATIEGCCRTVDRFFVWLDERGGDLASVKITMIDEVIAGYHARGHRRHRIVEERVRVLLDGDLRARLVFGLLACAQDVERLADDFRVGDDVLVDDLPYGLLRVRRLGVALRRDACQCKHCCTHQPLHGVLHGFDYSPCKATIGSRREAWYAGCIPKKIPTTDDTPSPTTTDNGEMKNSQSV